MNLKAERENKKNTAKQAGKKYLKFVLPLAALLVSLNGILFTWHLLQSGCHYRQDNNRAAKHMYAAVTANPNAYKVFLKYNGASLDNLIVKAAIYDGDSKKLNNPGLRPPDVGRIRKAFRNNIFLNRLLTGAGENIGPIRQGNWENLDDVSLDILADPTMNDLTISIFKERANWFSPDFIANLADFCAWKKNTLLTQFFRRRFPHSKPPSHLPPEPASLPSPGPTAYPESLKRLEGLMKKVWKLEPGKLGKNLLRNGDFQETAPLGRCWHFSRMAGTGSFGEGSFTMGLETLGTDNGTQSETNKVLRIMGFHIKVKKGRSNPRAGAWYKARIPLKQGYYVFSFDYAARTGKEAPALWLWRGIKETRLTAEAGSWKKAVYILDNRASKYNVVKPMVRMWGTGTLHVDNIYFGFIDEPAFFLPEGTPHMKVENWQPGEN